MAKVLLICAGGMSSSVVAKRVTQYLQDQGHDISLDFGGVFKGEKEIEAGNYDYYLIGPHLKTHYPKFEGIARETGRGISLLPKDAYAPVPWAIEKVATIILTGLQASKN